MISAVSGQMRTVTVRGRSLRVAMRGGSPQWPPLLLCNGIGASLELLQPFVDALDPRREVVRFDMPGIGGSRGPVVPYHLWTLAPLLSGLRHLDLVTQAGHLAPLVEAFLGAETQSANRTGTHSAGR